MFGCVNMDVGELTMPNVYLSEDTKKKLEDTQEELDEQSVGSVKMTDVVEEALTLYRAQKLSDN